MMLAVPPLRHAYLIARYADERNWLGLALATTPDGKRLALDIVRMQDGRLKRLKQGGTRVDAPDAFTTLRLDVAGNTLAMYVNGRRINSVDEPALPPARVGVLAQNGDFELDDLRVGDAAPSFAVWSSAPDVATASLDGDTVVITPRRAGAATVSVSDARDNNAAASLAVRVGPAFTASGQADGLQGKVVPAAGAADVQVDTPLHIRFDSEPKLGPGASVRIYRAADDARAARFSSRARVFAGFGGGKGWDPQLPASALSEP